MNEASFGGTRFGIGGVLGTIFIKVLAAFGCIPVNGHCGEQKSLSPSVKMQYGNPLLRSHVNLAFYTLFNGCVSEPAACETIGPWPPSLNPDSIHASPVANRTVNNDQEQDVLARRTTGHTGSPETLALTPSGSNRLQTRARIDSN